MPYHDWSDNDFDWSALEQACIYLETNCKRWARMVIHTKEKYGEMRVSTWPMYGLSWYQTAVLKFFWKRAAKKWPHISKEILAEYYWTFDEEKMDD